MVIYMESENASSTEERVCAGGAGRLLPLVGPRLWLLGSATASR